MKKLIKLFGFIGLFLLTVSMNAQSNFQDTFEPDSLFFGKISFGISTLIGGDTMATILSNFNSQTSYNYTIQRVRPGDILIDNVGNFFEITQINDTTAFNADVSFVPVFGTGSSPYGSGLVSRPHFKSKEIAVPTNNILGISDKLLAEINAYNLWVRGSKEIPYSVCKPSVFNAKIIGNGDGFTFALSGNAYDSSPLGLSDAVELKFSYGSNWIKVLDSYQSDIRSITFKASNGEEYNTGSSADIEFLKNFVDLDFSSCTGSLGKFKNLKKTLNNGLNNVVGLDYRFFELSLEAFCTLTEYTAIKPTEVLYNGMPRNIDICNPVGKIACDWLNDDISVFDENNNIKQRIKIPKPWGSVYDKYGGNFYITANNRIYSAKESIDGNIVNIKPLQTSGSVDLTFGTSEHYISNISIDPLIRENGQPVFWVGEISPDTSQDNVYIVKFDGSGWIKEEFAGSLFFGTVAGLQHSDKYYIKRLGNGDFVCGSSIGMVWGHYDGISNYSLESSYTFENLTDKNSQGVAAYVKVDGTIEILSMVLGEHVIRRFTLLDTTDNFIVNGDVVAGVINKEGNTDGGLGINLLNAPQGSLTYKNGKFYFASLLDGSRLRLLDKNTFKISTEILYESIR